MNEYECTVTSHSDRQLALGVVYPVHEDSRSTRYRLDAYFFTPFHLGLTADRYGVKQFFSDLSSYIRYTPASIRLAKIIEPDCDVSPLVRIRRLLEEAVSAREVKQDDLLYELRVLVNTYHAQSRETRRLIGRLIRMGEPSGDVLQRLELFFTETGIFLEQLRALKPLFLDSPVPALIQQGWAWADESISLQTQKEWQRLHAACDGRPDLAGVQVRLARMAGAEQQYRVDRKYATVMNPSVAQSGELLLYRESMLKKWAQTAMYMEAVPNQVGGRIAHILAGIAAAVAMAFAVAATFLAERLFASYSLPWALLIVVAYIFKDRIKEVLRTFFSTHLPHLVSDEMRNIIDSRLGRKVGSIRSSVRFCSARDLPDAVVRLRNAAANPFRAVMPPENIIHFQSVLKLNGRQLKEGHQRLEAITNILRLKLAPWLAGMDDPTSSVPFAGGGQVEAMEASRVYHVNLVTCLSMTNGQSQELMAKHRLILNRDGIVRIEGL